jgi:TRAP-type C4-dicarboxylate transport system permease small subunit
VTRLAWLAAINRRVLNVCELVLVVMLALIMAEVIARSFFSISLQFVDEYAAYTLVWVTFLGMSVALHDGALFRVGIIYDRLRPLAQTALQVVWDVLALVFSSISTWACLRQVISTHEREMVSQTVLATPLWIPQLVMPVGGALVVLVLLAITASDLARLARGGQ